MKKITLLFIMSFLALVLVAQTYVNTEPMNKNAILEEFTGVKCTNCPAGNVVMASILAANPNTVFAVAYHPSNSGFTVPYAGDPDFRRSYPSAFYSTPYCGSTLFMPSAFIDRRVWEDGNRMQNSGEWGDKANTIMSEASPANMGLSTNYDSVNQTLNITVEVYYTDNMTDDNHIYVMLSENYLVSQQSGATGPYTHMHTFREAFVDQWGDLITDPTTAGSLVTLQYSWSAVSSGYVMENCEVLAFIENQTTGEIITGVGVHVGESTTGTGLMADFDASVFLTCENDQVDFTDLSYSTDSTVQTWQWSFEGGTPATSSVQNPTVQYASDGSYDVELIVFDGIYIDTLLREDYITVEAIPDQTDMPAGPTDVCNTYDYEYTTNPVQYADSYIWEVTPSDAGVMSGNDTSAVFETSGSWFGTCSIKVRGYGLCGTAPWSSELTVELRDNPGIFVLTGEGGYCSGSSGSELILDDSETGVDYELFLDEVSTGIILPGTGDSLTFGFFTDDGLYTAEGYNDYCLEAMVGQIYVHEIFPPAQPSVPAGPEAVCNSDTTTYTTTVVSGADNYVWSLNPPESGELFPDMESVEIAWSNDFEGETLLTVQSENDCGLSVNSDALSIDIIITPAPEIIGSQLVCDDEEEDYETTEIAGNTYVWEVVGGEIVTGAGTAQVIILWGAPGTGNVTVSEESPDGCIGTSDEFEVVIDECIGLTELSDNNVKLYPNPASQSLTVDMGSISDKTNIKIINGIGALIEIVEIEGGIHIFNTSTYENGLYFMQIISNNEILTNEKFVVRN